MRRFPSALLHSVVVGGLLLTASTVCAAPTPADAPVSLLPAPRSTSPTASPAVSPAAPPTNAAPAGVMVEDLGALNQEALGLLDPARGSLPASLWQGSARATVVPLLAALPESPASPSLAALSRRVLLSAGSVPTRGSETSDAPIGTVLTLKLQALARLGLGNDLRTLSQNLPPAARTPEVERAINESLLVDGQTDTACAGAAAAIQKFDDVYWQKLMAFCHQLGGRSEAASAQVTMLRDQNVDDTVFFWAAESLSGLRVLPLNSYPQPSPLTAAMLRAAGKAYPSGTLVDPAPWLARLVALDNKADPVVRAVAAEQAFTRGGLSRDELMGVFEAIPLSDADRNKSLPTLAAEDSAKAAAQLWQMVKAQNTPTAIAAAISNAVQQASRRGQILAAAQLYAPLAEGLQPTPELLGFSETAGRILYAAGRFDAARGWYRLAVAAAASDANAAQAADVLWPLERMTTAMAFSNAPPADRLTAWRSRMVVRAQAPDVKESAIRRVARQESRLLTLLQATGDQIPNEQWAALWSSLPAEDTGTATATARWQALSTAADAHRVGETVALILLSTGGKSLAQVSDATLDRALSALRGLGMDSDARRLAVEAAVAAGL